MKFELTNKFLKNRVKEGNDNNIICFDQDASTDCIITKKLINIMQVCLWRYYKDNLKYIFSGVPTKIEVPDNGEMFEFHLGDDFDFTSYFTNELKGSIPSMDNWLIVGIGQNGEVILGSY